MTICSPFNNPVCNNCGALITDGAERHKWDTIYCCPRCEEVFGLSHFNAMIDQLEESVDTPILTSFLRAFFTGATIAAVITLLLLLIITLIGVSFLIPELFNGNGQGVNVNQIMNTFLGLLWFLACCLIAVSLISLPLAFFHEFDGRHRNIKVHNGMLMVDSCFRHVAVPLSECEWQEGGIRADVFGFYFLRSRPSIYVCHPESKSYYGCGFTQEYCILWKGFFQASKTDYRCASKCDVLRLSIRAGLGILVGSLVGMAISSILLLFPANAVWATALIFMAMVDGGIIALSAPLLRCVKSIRQTRLSQGKTLEIAVVFANIGILAGIGIGVVEMAGCGLINGLLGALFGRYLLSSSNSTASRSKRQPDTDITTTTPDAESISSVDEQHRR